MNAAEPLSHSIDDNGVEARIRREIRDIGIPPRPAILTRIDNEIRKEEPDFRLLAEIIGSDVGLAASVIKVSNSPYFGLGRQVRSVGDALLVLGLKVTVHTIAGIALQKTFPHIPSLERFWDATARTARTCGWLAQRLRDRIKLRPDDAYTFGLFRDCGIPVLMIPFSEYQGILKQANNDAERSFTAIEDEHLSINHAIVGSEMAEDWLLPSETFDAIRYHHDLAVIDGNSQQPVSERTRQLIAIAQIAEYLVQQCTGLCKSHEWDKLGASAMRVLQINEAELASWVEAAHEVVADVH